MLFQSIYKQNESKTFTYCIFSFEYLGRFGRSRGQCVWHNRYCRPLYYEE